jgi:hypothetical protein
MVFHKLFNIGDGSIYEWVCATPGMATVASFIFRADLPKGAQFIATDRGCSLWVYDGSGWNPTGGTGSLAVTTARYLSPADYNALLVNSTGSNRQLTIPVGLPNGFRARMFQQSTGNLNVIAGSGVTLVTMAGANKTSAQGAVIELIKTIGETYTLTGDLA